MDAEASPSRSVATPLRGALKACRGAWSHAARLALDIALPTLCVACREPVHGEGVCATCWAKLSFIAPPFCPRLGIPFAWAHVKLAGIALWPIGKVIVPA